MLFNLKMDDKSDSQKAGNTNLTIQSYNFCATENMHQSLWTFFTIVFVIRQVTFDIHLAKIKKVLSNYMIAISVIVGNNDKKCFNPSCGISFLLPRIFYFLTNWKSPKKP